MSREELLQVLPQLLAYYEYTPAEEGYFQNDQVPPVCRKKSPVGIKFRYHFPLANESAYDLEEEMRTKLKDKRALPVRLYTKV